MVLLVPPDVDEPERLLDAGLLTTADVVAVNKCDQDGAALLLQTLAAGAAALEIGTGAWRPRVLGTSALRGQGLDELAAAITDHRDHLERSGELGRRRTRAARAQLQALLLSALRERVSLDAGLGRHLDELATKVVDHRIDAATAVADVVASIDLPTS